MPSPNKPTIFRRRRAVICAAALLFAGSHIHLNADTVVIKDPELAGISGFREYWDKPTVLAADGATQISDQGRFGESPVADWSTDQPGAIAFDAVHRSLLVRFPTVAEGIARRLNAGYSIEKVELVLPFKDTEYFPLDYDMPAGMSFLGKMWVDTPPNWHAQAWPLLQPWKADPKIGPTHNAAVNGQRYWEKFGASGSHKDRYPTPFPRAEVSNDNPRGVIDLTSYFDNPDLGTSLGERLRLFSDAGLLIKKEEIYDARYWQGGYEWGVATGQRAILIDAPELHVTFTKGESQQVTLPVSSELAWAKDPPTEPTAIVPSADEFEALKAKLSSKRPEQMADWQWQRIQELNTIGGHATIFPQTYNDYLEWIDSFLSLHPRAWKGFTAGEMAAEYSMFREAIPAPVKDHLQLYWWAWLMPDREYESLVQGYIGGKEAEAYYETTNDWRGNFSVYRTYLRNMGTTNFNSWAISGGMFGGWLIEDEGIIADARHGYDRFMTRLWTWSDGSSQEGIDHYYFAHTLGPLKTIADHAPFPEERLAGRINLEKNVDELISTWHPNLKRFVSSSGRTGIAYPLYLQEGLTYIVHTLSQQGALTDVGAQKIAGRKPSPDGSYGAFGFELSPAQVAQQTIDSPWGDSVSAVQVDHKTLPYESIRSYTKWGGFKETPLWKKSYLGEHYGMASIDIAEAETVPFMVQWRREPKGVKSYTDLGTLLARYGINNTEFLDSLYHDDIEKVTDILASNDNNRRKQLKLNPNGIVGTQAAPTAIVQGGNTAILFASPSKSLMLTNKDRPIPSEVTSLQMSLALFNFEASPSWKLYIDGQHITQLPATAKFGQRITVHDGVTYLGILPLPATQLGPLDAEVFISTKGVPTEMQGGGQVKVTLTIDAFNYNSSTPFNQKADPAALDTAIAGYIVRASDAAESGSFTDFQKAFAAEAFDYEVKDGIATVRFGSGAHELVAAFNPTAAWKQPTSDIFPVRSYGGVWPYLAEGEHRNNPNVLQSTTGRLEKNGATLQIDAGKMAYLKAFPEQDTYIAINPFKEAVDFTFTLPNGATIQSDGKISQCRIEANTEVKTIRIDHASPISDELATTMSFNAADAAEWTVMINGNKTDVSKISLH